MNKKTALTILVVILIIAILLIGFFLFFQKQNEQKNPIIDAARNFFGGFFPSEKSGDSNISDTNSPDVPTINNVIPRLRQISNFPVAGGVMFDRTSTSSSLLIQENLGTTTGSATSSNSNQKITEVVYRFVERTTGHIYETTSRDLSQKRITNTTIPKIYQAFFSGDGENLAMIYLNDNAIETFLGKINYPQISTSTETEMTNQEKKDLENFASVTGTFLPPESFAFTKAQTSNDFAFLNTTDNANGGYIVNLYTGNLKTPLLNKNIFDLNTSEWKIQILKDGTLTLNSKPSVVSEGFLYFLNPKEGILKKKLGNTTGLTSLTSPDGKKIFYSYYDAGSTKNVIYDSSKKVYTSLNLATFPGDKCVWSQKDTITIYCAIPTNLIRGDFPDNWYQGKYAFNDSLVKINTDNFTVTNLMEANSETQTNLDIINLQISPSEDYLMFMNKTDLILWSLDII